MINDYSLPYRILQLPLTALDPNTLDEAKEYAHKMLVADGRLGPTPRTIPNMSLLAKLQGRHAQ